MTDDAAPAQRRRRFHLPLRTRLTLWYLLTLAAILVLFLTFLYWQMQRSLLAQVDAALQMAASQALITVEADGNRLAFQNVASNVFTRRLSDSAMTSLFTCSPRMAPSGICWAGPTSLRPTLRAGD
jgi:hypothetical protein